MAQKDSLLRAAFLVLLVAGTRAEAQVVERPLPFDSAGRVGTVTPSVAARLRLKPPAWPVAGDFVDARLYSISSGGTVLVVARMGGELERYPLNDEELASLRGAVETAMTGATGRVVAELPREGDARGAFARNQMILAAAVYGPSLASLAENGQTASALYLLTVGATFFIVSDMVSRGYVTATQNTLATDGAIRGYVGASNLLNAFGGDDVHRKAYAVAGLAGAIGGSAAGFRYGTFLTAAEAQAAKKWSTIGAAAAVGALGTAGVYDESGGSRFGNGAAVAGGLVGYLLGPGYPRRAGYVVTAGDVRTLHVGAVIGAMAGLTPFVGEQTSAQARWGGSTAGGLLGVTIADRALVRRFNYGGNDATLLWLGTIAGTLVGAAITVMIAPDDPVPVMALLTGGAFLGAVGGHNLANPDLAAKASDAGGASGDASREPAERGQRLRLSWNAAGLAMVAARQPGNFTLARLVF